MITLYSTHCPRCNVLKKKLKQRNIDYKEIDNVETIKAKGYLSVPILEVDNLCMDFKQAVNWINLQEDFNIGD
ncbi:hypothetical protein IMSAG049_01726 [Clostridiales bacterium]|nr:hypothetical protein IMSAG049_01726 [Clostridiales bacterium]